MTAAATESEEAAAAAPDAAAPEGAAAAAPEEAAAPGGAGGEKRGAAAAARIGLDVADPPRAADSSEKNNPFNGSLRIRGKLFEGTVVSAKARGTVVIEKESPVYFTKFKRYARSRSSIHAHVPSNLDVAEGNRVLAAECRPLAKSVSYVVVEVRR